MQCKESEPNKKIAPLFSEAIDLAEKVGFEPTVMLPPRLISSTYKFEHFSIYNNNLN